MARITFKFEEKEKTPIHFEIEEGDSILDIAQDYDVELNHNCGGVCACSTCHVYVEVGMDSLAEISDKEEDFIDRARNPKLNSRLACQCVLESDNNIVVIIPDQSNIIGHH
jgi:2Fe-2S ferredoxin